MKISEFIFLDEKSMKSAVLQEGVLVGKRRYPQHFVFLFQMEDYYAEVYFDMANKAAVEYRAFTNLNTLEPYLDGIGIDDLLLD